MIKRIYAFRVSTKRECTDPARSFGEDKSIFTMLKIGN